MVKFLDAAKANNELGWNPQVLLNAGLRRTIDWYRKHIYELTHLEDTEYPPAGNLIDLAPVATSLTELHHA